MHYWANGSWSESREIIEPTKDGAIARQGQHKVRFAGNLNTSGAIELTTPDGKRLTSHVLALAYTEAATGRTVIIGEVQDSEAQLVSQNQIIYRNAFTDIKADIRYTYTLNSIEQDVIMRQLPPPPESYGLIPEQTSLEVITEFLDPPVPTKQTEVISLRPGATDAPATDEHLDFGVMKFGSGAAFLEQAGARAEDAAGAPVAKHWRQIGGRTLLIETVDYGLIKEKLRTAQLQSAVPARRRLLNSDD
jgi:hypothetical protein